MKISIIGGGHSAHVLVAILGGKHEVRVLSSKANQWQHEVKTTFTGLNQVKVGQLQLASNNPDEAVNGCDMVILCLPLYLYLEKLQVIAPYLKKDVIIGSIFGQDYFPHTIRRAGINTENVTMFSFANIPWVCRTNRYGESATASMKASCPVAISGPEAQSVLDLVTSEFMVNPEVFPNFLLPMLFADNATLHPANLYSHFSEWPDKVQYFKKVSYFYRDLNDEGYQLIVNLDNEVMSIVSRFQQRFPNLQLATYKHSMDKICKEMYPQLPFTNGLSTKDVIQVFFTKEPILTNIKCPMVETSDGRFVPDLKHRMFKDDIAHGLCNIYQLGKWIGVTTPDTERLIQWGEQILGKEYIVDGALRGRDSHECDLYGITLNELVNECVDMGASLSK